MTILEKLDELKNIADISTPVVAWYPHPEDATVRGPYWRDADFIAFAHNNVPAILAEVERLQARVIAVEEIANARALDCNRVYQENTQLKARIEKMERAIDIAINGFEAVMKCSNEKVTAFDAGKQIKAILEGRDEKL